MQIRLLDMLADQACVQLSRLICRYAPKYVKEYVDASIVGDSLHVAEFWVDMR